MSKIKTNTYITCSSNLVNKLRQIPNFELNLGQSLKTFDRFAPQDVNIQKHYIFFNQIIQMCGYIGSLAVYNTNNIGMDELGVYNENESLMYKLDGNLGIYDNINTALGIFFEKIGIAAPVISEPEKVEELVYIRPDKKLSEMTKEERILFSRNRE
jgi:hypothetical protein